MIERNASEFGGGRLSWKRFGAKRYVVAYDPVTMGIVWPLVDYAIFLTDRIGSDPKTVESAILGVAAYRYFLVVVSKDDNRRTEKKLGSLGFEESTDTLLRSFRDQEVERVCRRINSNHDKMTAQRTVNAKLIHIYHFLNWYRCTHNLEYFLGPSQCSIASTLGDSDVNSRRRGRYESRTYERYPLLFRRVHENPRTVRAYVATEKDKAYIRDYFRANFTYFVAVRNLLIMEIADRVGWRRESINSLACEQFSPGRLEAMDARGLACVPDRQKFGYRDAFYIPPSLAIEIASFINDVRSTFLEEMGWFDKVATGPVFISARDGNGLTDKSISKIFGRAFAAAGAPRRAGIKSFRSKFANDAIAAETLARLELGLDTSAPSVAAAVSVDLGHSHPESIRAYVEQHQSRLASRKRNP